MAHSHGGHGHDHGHSHSRPSSIKMLGLAIIFTLLFSIIEFIGGHIANSLALIGDAAHMASDSLALLMALVATWIASKPASSQHSYGLGRAEIIAGGASSLLMIVISISIAIAAIERLQNPHPIQGGPVMVIAIIGILINFLVAYLLSKGQRTLNVRAAILHVIGDLLGSFAALASGAIIYFSGWLPIDPILSIFISVLIAYSSIRLILEALRVLMEGVPLHLDLKTIQSKMCDVTDVIDIHDLHVWTLSSGRIALSAHVLIVGLNNWQLILYTLKAMLGSEYHISHVTLQIELEGSDCQPCQPP